jgi:DNA helicase-2/ATP-dependent DNA helicase PcrA
LAILLRQPHQSVALENHLLDQGIDYQTRGFHTYLMRPEVLFVRGLIAHARQDFPAIERQETRERILQSMLMFCGSFVHTDTSSDEDQAALNAKAIKEVAANPSLATAFVDNQVLRNATDATRWLVEDAIDVIAANDTHRLLDRFVKVLKPQQLAARVMVRRGDIEQVGANIAGLIDSAATFDHVEAFFRAMNEREIRQHAMRGKDRIVLSSIEAAKGLEYDHVILPNLNKGEFAVGGNTTDNRNLLYVGLTRARHLVTILYDGSRPSHYLVDAGLL